MFTALLKKVFPYRILGRPEIEEEFTRFTLLWTPWGAIYLHRLKALIEPPECHDRPWGFVTIIFKGGYWEYAYDFWEWRGPGSILFRPAIWRHNVVTEGVSWSIIITGRKFREWGFKSC